MICVADKWGDVCGVCELLEGVARVLSLFFFG